MELQQATKGDPKVVVSLADLSRRAGITLDQARFALAWMLEHAFAAGISAAETTNLQITVKGMDEVTRLRMPFGVRHWNIPGVPVLVITTFVAGLLSGLVVLLLGKLF
jgi:hypothetical protein